MQFRFGCATILNMKILFIIGDLWKNSVDRQLAEIVQELLKVDAETQILETFDLSDATLNSVKSADAVWFIINGQGGVCPSTLTDFLANTPAHMLKGKHCTLSSIGGEDGGVKPLKALFKKIKRLGMLVFDEAVTCVPLKSGRFELPDEYFFDLSFQEQSFLKFCGKQDESEDRALALSTIAELYLKLMKAVSQDNRKPSQVKIDYPDIVTDVGTFNVADVPYNLKELHYEIDAISSDNKIDDEEIEPVLLKTIQEKW